MDDIKDIAPNDINIKMIEKIINDLHVAFCWEDTGQKAEYWLEVIRNLRAIRDEGEKT